MIPKADPAAVGRIGEELAAAFYLQNGYELLERNWRWHNRGELDIIAYHKMKKLLAVCEVKTRSAGSPAFPLEAVTPQKQKKIRFLTEIYCLRSSVPVDSSLRFDVIGIVLENGTAKHFCFLENAF